MLVKCHKCGAEFTANIEGHPLLIKNPKFCSVKCWAGEEHDEQDSPAEAE